MDDFIDTHDEETPLLQRKQGEKEKRTPLPKLQIGIVLLLQVCEPICSQSIYPYINELVSSLDIIGGDETKVGYYAGLIESLFFATEALTVYQWSRTSDKIGRKPVLLLGLVGTMLSMLSFGLSTTFFSLVISRCLCGLLNGNIGVMKSAMGELTDQTNRADAFALMPVVWALGATFGPVLGGILARPADTWPTIFTAAFWKEYPYFLPCLATASFVLITFVITVVWFKELTEKWKKDLQKKKRLSTESQETIRAEPQHHDLVHVPLRRLLIFPVVISIANYVSLAFLNISVNALLPLFMHMPLNMGGLDLEPVRIGYIMGLYGCGTGLFQMLFFARIVRAYGTRRVFIWSMASFIPVFMMFPVISVYAKTFGVGTPVYLLITLMLGLLFFMDTAYGCVFMYVTESAPNKQSLGATNGLAQTTVSAARAVGPALSNSLFAFSVRHNILGGYGVYAILALLGCGALFLAAQLPKELWKKEDAAYSTEEN